MALQLYKIATVEVGSAGASSMTFTNIPQGYTDLKLVYSSRNQTGSVGLSINGNTASLTGKGLYGNGASALTENFSGSMGMISNSSTYTANSFANAEIYFPNYASANNKSFSSDGVSETNATTAYMELFAGLWSSSSAITSVTLTSSSGNIFEYSTATLYGIL